MLQETVASEQQARSKAEAELAALQESARLDFERIGALSEENAELKVFLFARCLCNRVLQRNISAWAVYPSFMPALELAWMIPVFLM